MSTRRIALAAIGAARAAWAAFDTGSHEAARSLHRLALFCAVRANDPDLRAHVVADAAAHHNHLGYHHDALDLVRIVEADERAAPPVRMAVHGVKARAYAHTGDADNCRKHLALAEQARAEPSADEPAWATTLRHPAHLHATSGHALAALAEHSGNPDDRDQAHQQLTTAVDTFDLYHHARAVGLCQARIAVLHLTTGEYEHGETWARRALATLDTVRSARLNRALAAVRNAAAKHPDHGPTATLAADIDSRPR